VVTVVVAVPVVGTMVAEATGTWGRVAMETWAQVALEIRILTAAGRMGEIDCSQQTSASNHTCGCCSLLPYA
jgi:hypothetical protein